MTKLFGSFLRILFDLIGNYGWTIIVFTIIVRIVLFPLSIQQRKSMEVQKKLNPQVQELQKKYAKDPQTLNAKTMELYKEHKYNPLSGCLPMLVQIPVIWSLFSLFRNAHEYIPADALHQAFLWLPNLIAPDTLNNILPGVEMFSKLPGVLPIIAAFFTYLTSKRAQAQTAAATAASGQKGPNMSAMTIMFPIMILVFGASYSAGLILYWAVSNIIQFLQDLIIAQMVSKENVS
ncbi:MAG TPA: YidC/Oxa1 family membrane protein insertase [Tissierellia bacterium]|jgi:YidC/Oxa1 family membrane protein insertase|nr:YidC/Oxa1 family membrane protein insertase [Tissierellia bacterium]